jgi:hypothetical protein
MDKNETDDVVELNAEQTEQVVGGKRFAGIPSRPAGHVDTVNNNSSGANPGLPPPSRE